jgi:hypothetical protein
MNLLELQVLVVISRVPESGAGPSLLDWARVTHESRSTTTADRVDPGSARLVLRPVQDGRDA